MPTRAVTTKNSRYSRRTKYPVSTQGGKKLPYYRRKTYISRGIATPNQIDVEEWYGLQTSIDYNGVIAAVSAQAQGYGQGNRVRNCVYMLGVSLKMQWNLAETSAGYAPETVRAMLIQDTMGGPVSMSSVLSQAGSEGATNSMVWPNYRKRYRILYDKVWKPEEFTTRDWDISGTTQYRRYFANTQAYIKVNNRQYFNGTGSNDYYKNNLFLYLMSSNIYDTQCAVRYSARIFYKNP